jgi:hypothetical protein
VLHQKPLAQSLPGSVPRPIPGPDLPQRSPVVSGHPLQRLPDSARLWVFGARRELSADAADALAAAAETHVGEWKAHGAPVVGGWELREGWFLLVGADEEATGVSGCSIDGLYRTLGGVERETGVELRDSSPVWFRGRAGEIRCVSRPDFRELLRSGEVNADTIVFDPTVRTLGEARAAFEKPLGESWHARAFAPGARS